MALNGHDPTHLKHDMQSVLPTSFKFIGHLLNAIHTLQFIHLLLLLNLNRLILEISSRRAPAGHIYLQKNLGIIIESKIMIKPIASNTWVNVTVGKLREYIDVVIGTIKQLMQRYGVSVDATAMTKIARITYLIYLRTLSIVNLTFTLP